MLCSTVGQRKAPKLWAACCVLRNVIAAHYVGNFGRSHALSECESAGPGGHALIALGFHPARAGNVDAGTEVIVLCQTSAAEMKLVDFAVNDRVIFAAKIASTAYRLFIRDR